MFAISYFGFSYLTQPFVLFFSRTISHQVVPIILEDEVEHSGYDRFGFAFLSDSETRRKKLVLLTKKFKDSLKENYRKRDQQLLTICRQFNYRPVKILGDFDPKELTEYFFGYRKMICSPFCAHLRSLLLLCLIFVVQIARADLAVEITEPRQFGYVLGDKIERIFVVESAKKVQLNKEKLKLGRIDTWFSVVNLRDLGVS